MNKHNIYSKKKNKGPENLIGSPLMGSRVTEKELETNKAQSLLL